MPENRDDGRQEDAAEVLAADEMRAAEDAAGTSPASRDLAAAQKQRDEYLDLLLRKTAEFDNYRKRVERERRDAADNAAAELLLELLPIVDNFERAQSAPADADSDAYRTGVELIHRQVLDFLRKRGVEPIQAVGERFDPHRHQAVDYVPSPAHEEGQIIEEYVRGYAIGDRLLRPSLVKVARGV